MIAEKLLLTIKEAANVANVSIDTIKKATFPRGPLISTRIGATRRGLRYSPQDLRAWVEGLRADVPTERAS